MKLRSRLVTGSDNGRSPQGESARAPNSPMSGEGMDTRTARPTKANRRHEQMVICCS
jgi:hypothetical protein